MRSRDVLLLALFSALIFFPAIDRAPLVVPLETARIEGASGGSYDSLLAAFGISIFGSSLFAARVSIALAAIGGVVAAYFAASSRRAGLFAAIIFATSPLYALEARTLAGDPVSAAATAIALAGFCSYLRTERVLHLAVALAGSIVAARGAGIVAGSIAPAFALVTSARRPHLRRALLCALTAIVAAAITALFFDRDGIFFGGVLQDAAPGAPGFEALLLRSASALFPCAALLPLALVLPLDRADLRATLAIAICVALAQALQVRLTATEQPPAAIGVFAVLAASILDALLDREDPLPGAALLAGAGVLALWSGYAITPANLAAPHWLGAIEPPKELTSIGAPPALAAIAGTIALGGIALAQSRSTRALLATVALAAGTATVLWTAHVLQPGAHRASSVAPQLDAYRAHAKPNEPLVAYHATKLALAFQLGAPVIEVDAKDALVAKLSSAQCAQALIPRAELGALDGSLGAYHVLTDPNTTYLLASTCLRAGERDTNPLRTHVARAPFPAPRIAARADYDGFAILGLDAPASQMRKDPLALSVHFAATSTLAPGAHVTLVLETRTGRIVHDAMPVDGLYPTEAWRAGDFIVDTHVLEVADNDPGDYEVFGIVVLDGDRLAPRPGPNVEPANTKRVHLGALRLE